MTTCQINQLIGSSSCQSLKQPWCASERAMSDRQGSSQPERHPYCAQLLLAIGVYADKPCQFLYQDSQFGYSF